MGADRGVCQSCSQLNAQVSPLLRRTQLRLICCCSPAECTAQAKRHQREKASSGTDAFGKWKRTRAAPAPTAASADCKWSCCRSVPYAHGCAAEGAVYDTAVASAASGLAAAQSGASAVEAAQLVWNTDQVKQLQDALRVYLADESLDTKGRWKAIAAAVDGKSAKDCLRKYKEIRAALKSTK